LLEWGFSEDELKIEQEVVEDEVPELEEGEAVSKLGEVYQLGRHRLMCGDATKIEDVEKLMDGKKADMVLTDPPYGVDFKYNEYDDSKGKENHKAFIKLWYPILKKFSDFIVITGGYGNQQIYFEIEPTFNTMVWYKKFGISRGFVSFATLTEPIYVYGKCPIRRYDTDFFEFMTDRTEGLHDEHPCPKPMKFMVALIEPQTKKDSIVLDVFGGSGTTLIACEQTNRICYGMEISEAYCDTIRRRYWKFTHNNNEDGWKEGTPIIS
jgi:DNA modification methylase